MNRLLVVLSVVFSLVLIPGLFAQGNDDFGFLKLKVTKVGIPLASYPVVLHQVIPAGMSPDGATQSMHLHRLTNANGRCTFMDKIHVKRPFTLEVGDKDSDAMEYFVTRRKIQTAKDSGATDMLIHINFPPEATFTMTKLGDDDLCRITCVLKNCKVKGLKFFMATKVGNVKIAVVEKGNVFDFSVPAPDKDDPEPIEYTLVLKEGDHEVRKIPFTVKQGQVRKDLTLDFGKTKDASE